MTRTRTAKDALLEWLGVAALTLLIVITVLLWQAQGQDGPTKTATAPAAKLTDSEELKFLNLLQRAIIKTVDAANAQRAQQQAIDEFNAFQAEVRKQHQWPEGTGFEPVDDQKHVIVHLPTDAKGSEVPKGDANDQKKEKH